VFFSIAQHCMCVIVLLCVYREPPSLRLLPLIFQLSKVHMHAHILSL